MAEQSGEEELASKTIFIQSKRFYFDVKQNQRGRFLKIAEVSSGGRKNRILMSMSIAQELCEQIDKLSEASNEKNAVRSTVIQRDDRKYYLDLKENDRGQFLRISMVSSNNPRTQIVIPIEGLQEIKFVLANLIDEYGNVDEHGSTDSLPALELNQLPESKNIHVGDKNFFFDLGSNSRGIFLRISEVRPNLRTSITIPEKIWSNFRDNLNEFIVFMNQQRQS